MIVGSLSDIVESTLVTDVSDPSKMKILIGLNPGVLRGTTGHIIMVQEIMRLSKNH